MVFSFTTPHPPIEGQTKQQAMLEEVGIWNPHPDLIFKHRLFESSSLKESVKTIWSTQDVPSSEKASYA